MDSEQQSLWPRSLGAELGRLAWPICVSMLSYSAMTVADTFFVGAIGPAALAGVGLAGTLAFALLCFGIGLLRGIKVVVSQAAGSTHSEQVEEIAAAGLLLAAAMSALVVVLAQAVALAVPLLSSNVEAGVHAKDYFLIRMWGTPLLYIFCSARETSYGVGNSRAPMVASLAANVLNIALDYCFIVELQLGTSGAAWATVVATFIEAALLLQLTNAPGIRSLHKGRRWVRKILNVGVATGGQFAIEVGAFTFLTILVAAMSETEMASHQVALSVVQLTTLPLLALSEAASIMAGQAVGANRDPLVIRIASYTLGAAVMYALACALILALGAAQIAGLFGEDADVRATAATLLHLGIAFMLSRAFNVVARGVLRGTGDVKTPAILCIAVSWLVLPPLTWLFGHVLALGSVGAWIGLTAETVLIAGLLWWRLLRGRWHVDAERSRSSIESTALASAAQ